MFSYTPYYIPYPPDGYSVREYHYNYFQGAEVINISRLLDSLGTGRSFCILWRYGGDAPDIHQWGVDDVQMTAYTGIEEQKNEIPVRVPKIFSDLSSVRIFLPFDVEVEIFDITGKKIQTIKQKMEMLSGKENQGCISFE